MGLVKGWRVMVRVRVEEGGVETLPSYFLTNILPVANSLRAHRLVQSNNSEA